MYLLTSAITGTFGLIFMIIWALLFVFTLLNILRNHNLGVGNKLIWIVIILVVPILGSLIYILWKSAQKPEA
ncbi:MAG TPA: PLDc N-terminal domain-containing protein [Mucilaginibacter sp.]